MPQSREGKPTDNTISPHSARATEKAPPGSGAKLSIMHGLAGEAANPRLKHRAAQLVLCRKPHPARKQKPRHRGAGLGGSILCLAIPGSRGPSETQQAHHPNAQPLRWLRAARRTRMKKPRRSGAKVSIEGACRLRQRQTHRDNTTAGCTARAAPQKKPRHRRAGLSRYPEGLPR